MGVRLLNEGAIWRLVQIPLSLVRFSLPRSFVRTTNEMLKSSENQGNKEGDDDAIFDKNPPSDDVFLKLRNLRVQDIGRVIVAMLNINSIRNKFYRKKFVMKDNIDILIIIETKIDSRFPE